MYSVPNDFLSLPLPFGFHLAHFQFSPQPLTILRVHWPTFYFRTLGLALLSGIHTSHFLPLSCLVPHVLVLVSPALITLLEIVSHTTQSIFSPPPLLSPWNVSPSDILLGPIIIFFLLSHLEWKPHKSKHLCFIRCCVPGTKSRALCRTVPRKFE